MKKLRKFKSNPGIASGFDGESHQAFESIEQDSRPWGTGIIEVDTGVIENPISINTITGNQLIKRSDIGATGGR